MKKTNIYCSPYTEGELDWNLIYKTPDNLFDTKVSERYRNFADKNNNIIYCPSFKNYTSKIFVIRNPITTRIVIEGKNAKVTSDNQVSFEIHDSRSTKNKIHIQYKHKWVFFAEDDVEMTLTSPHFDSTSYNGVLCPGALNISKWFRSINLEYVFDAGDQEIVFEEGTPLAYLHFNTPNKIEMSRYHMTNDIRSIIYGCDRSSQWESNVPLVKRYNRFIETRTHKKALKLIKEQLF